MIKAIIFDADGVVIRIEKYFSQRLADDFDVQPEKIQKFFRSEFQKCLIGKADLKIELKKYLKSWKWKKSVDELLEFWFNNEKDLDSRFLDLISECKAQGIICCLATNNEKYRTQYLKDNLKLDEIFAEVFSSCDVGCLKEDINFWEKIQEKLSELDPDEILVVDDNQKNVESAAKYGFESIHYTEWEILQEQLKAII